MSPAVGAYGLQVVGLRPDDGMLPRVSDELPLLRLAFEERIGGGGRGHVGDGRVVLPLGGRRSLVVDRASSQATYRAPRPPTSAQIAHPLLMTAAAVRGRWAGYELFHAAGIVVDGGVWAVAGDKGAGKSTIAAAMAGRGYPVTCDDMLVLRGGTAFAGPRCIDLRRDAARWMAVGEPVHADCGRERWRVPLGPLGSLDAELPIRGWVFLGWGKQVESRPLAGRAALARVAAAQMGRGLAADPVRLLELTALPAWELTRPPDWASLPASLACLEAGLASVAELHGAGQRTTSATSRS